MALEIFIGFCRHRVCAGGVCRARQKPFGKKGAIVLILIAFVIAAVWLMQLARTPMLI